jgi:hypothetical protein
MDGIRCAGCTRRPSDNVHLSFLEIFSLLTLLISASFWFALPASLMNASSTRVG